MGNQKPWIKPRQPRFQNQWIAKTKENTNKNRENQDFRTNGQPKPSRIQKHIKQNNISEPMGNENNREYTKQQINIFQDQ